MKGINKEQLVNLAKKAFLYLGKYDLKDLLGYITSAITIVAFLLAVDYFSAKPSLSITLHSQPRGYYMDSLLEYYHANEINFPKQLLDDQSLRKLFTRDTKLMDPNYVHIASWTSDEALIGAIVKGQEIDYYVKHRTDLLEKQIGKYNYVKHIYGYIEDRGWHDEDEFGPTLDYIESKLSPSDYYIFLAALIRSREVGHVVFIKNDGDLDLKNVKITFPAPLSKVTETRANNILSCKPATTLLHEVIDGTSDCALRLPSFKKGESLSLDIRTRENEINRNEVFTSYERDNLINRDKTIWYFVLILIGMFVSSQVFKGRKPKVGSL